MVTGIFLKSVFLSFIFLHQSHACIKRFGEVREKFPVCFYIPDYQLEDKYV
jgi:hypothetical protein